MDPSNVSPSESDEGSAPPSAFQRFGRRATLTAAFAGKSFKKMGMKVKMANRFISKKRETKPEEPDIRRLFTFDPSALKRGATVSDLFEKEEKEEDFNEIVDQDDERVEEVVSQGLVGFMVESFAFRFFILAVIVVNAVLIVLQTNEDLSLEYAWLFSIFDYIVLTIFVWELLLKWYNGFFIYWRVGWNILDFFIILTLFLGPTLSFLGSSRILRILRVIRAFRSLRSISALTGLTVVVQTILQSIPDMTNIALLLVIIMVVLSVAGVALFSRDFPEYFGNLGEAMFTMFVCVTQDGWMGMFNNFQESPNHFLAGACYFIVCIIVGAFVFANLVVAVVVTNLDKAIREIHAENKKREDTLSTKPVAEDDEHHHLEHDVPIVSMESVIKHGNLTQQKPLFFGDFSHITPEKFENYIVVLTALEENLTEYKRIRYDLDKIFELVYSINEEKAEGAIPKDDSRATPSFDPSFKVKDFGRKGDILSNLMELEKRTGLPGMPDSYRQYIKETAKILDHIGQSKHLQVPGSTVDPSDISSPSGSDRKGDKK
ncbi:cation channel sperm-associated protein 4-like [Acanthaster planci]|uniref:Cation channel sperm-associated protein 4-like n=1 Tax=Acanthaster planci TaxID=133434 RepID=A0A8B7YAI6_ACAPL|nr:cation channel sperm-associated protein 4-like [Acanthaster planci]